MSFFATLGISLLAGGVVFFLSQAVLSVVQRKEAGRIAVLNAVVAERQRLAERPKLNQRILYAAAARGYTGTLGPLMLAGSGIYLLLTVVLSLLNPPIFVVILGAIGGTALIVWGVGGWAAGKRKAMFDRQLLEMLSMLAGQLESGVSIQKGLERVAMGSEEPLRGEMLTALQQTAVDRDLVGAMQRLSYRYPSRAFDLFVATLEIDRDIGAPIEPALREAAEILERDFALNEETRAETGQVRAEFYGIVGVMAFIVFLTISSGGNQDGPNPYFSGLGLVVLIMALSWTVFGIVRALRMLNQAVSAKPAKLGKRNKPLGEEV